ncbi:MAG TPA: response regulator [Holophagaceae bacterium]|jgi:DNA-binding response OmpR family regulator|nr:response regulator [Holophagaceae bacterium]
MKTDFLPDPGQPGRILVVDDDAKDLQILALHLAEHPFQLTLATSGQEALALCETTPFEAILSDLFMPGMNGLEFCRRLRGTKNSLTPFVLLTGNPAEEGWITQGLEAGALDYLPKSASQVHIVSKLKVLVRLSRQQAALSASERQEALLEVTGGAAHELSQPLASARLLLDILERQKEHPSPEQMSQLRDFIDRTASILDQIRGLRVYVTKPYPSSGPILDLEKSREASGAHAAYRPAKPGGSE